MTDSSIGEKLKEVGLMSHLVELRDRLLRIVAATFVALIILFPFRNTIYSWLSAPLTRHLPEGSSMIAIDVISPFLAPFKMVLMLSIVVVIPYIMHHIWAFIAPGLYKHEKRLALPLAISSTLLFYLGMAFAYFAVFPLVFDFMSGIAPEGVQVMTDINRYLDFVIKLFLAFGFAFEVPIATFLIVSVGITTTEKLGKSRPYVFVGAFVAGMLLTPPDIISQVMLAIPIWLLFELGLFMAKKFAKPPVEKTTAAAEPSADVEVSDEDMVDDAEHRPLTDEEMEAELSRIEDNDADNDTDNETGKK